MHPHAFISSVSGQFVRLKHKFSRIPPFFSLLHVPLCQFLEFALFWETNLLFLLHLSNMASLVAASLFFILVG